MKLLHWLERIFRRRHPRRSTVHNIDELRIDFKSRYHNFRLLLTANNKTLEMMSEIDEALAGERPIGMEFVRSRCTRIAVNVFQIIRHLDQISPGKYPTLFDRFRTITHRITPLLVHRPIAEDTPLILPLTSIKDDQVDLVGPKIATLAELMRVPGLSLPKGFVITTEGNNRFMDLNGLRDELNRMIQTAGPNLTHDHLALSLEMQRVIVDAHIPKELSDAILQNYHELELGLGQGVPVAMRSSAHGEDEPGESLAGMYQSVLDVTEDTILTAYKKVIASKYSVQAMTYRHRHGIRSDEITMSVGCMPMVDAVAGGIIYSQNPLDSSDDSIIILATHGRPASVVDGSGSTDRFSVSRDDPGRAIVRDSRITTNADSRAPVTDVQLRELAELALTIEDLRGTPQDIEWAIDRKGAIVILQSRPLSSPDAEQRDAQQPPVEANSLMQGGITASRGAAAGPVFVAGRESEAARFPIGAVLVVAQPLTEWATLLDRATAVVSEQGRVACHLASVARELEVPALFALPGATSSLTDGTVVTVDADRRVIYSDRVDELIERRGPRELHFRGSPVHHALEEAAKHIVPLGLLEPDSPDFRPRNCETFHDLTRYCHEKAVGEMFDSAVEQSFADRQSKQLLTDVPMQFWIIDLDDGFVPGHQDPRYVRLEEITSIPMLAIWRGMTAIPWEGPPPVNPRGFLQILAGSTADPGLDPALPSGYASRNYFLISKQFCSLQSRFGYHFASAEALISERATENYASFQFKGGAAGRERRELRARMIAEVLEEQGFRVNQHRDSLRARIEGFERPLMERLLAALGYLLIHTRQLDMVMTDEAAVAEHKQKIFDDLEQVERAPS